MPLWAAGALMVAARLVGGALGGQIITLALVLALLAIPVALPRLVFHLGALLARMRRPGGWLAGRRLSRSARSLARPAVAVGAIVFVTGAATGVYQRLSTTENPAPSAVVHNFVLDWRSPRHSDLEALRSRLPQADIVPVQEDDQGRSRVVFASCDHALDLLADPGGTAEQCQRQDSLPPAVASQAQRQLHLAATVDPDPPFPGDGPTAAVLITGGADLSDGDIWRASNGVLPAVNLARLGPEVLAPPASRSWIVGTGAAGILLLIGAMLHAFGNRVLALVGEDRRLLRIGLDAPQVRQVQRWTLITPLLVSIAVGTGAALVFTWAGSTGVELAVPVTGLVIGEAAAITALSALLGLSVLTLQRSWLNDDRSDPPRSEPNQRDRHSNR